MSARDDIIRNLAQNRPPEVSLPTIPKFDYLEDLPGQFSKNAELSFTGIDTAPEDWQEWIQQRFPSVNVWYSAIDGLEGTMQIYKDMQGKDLAQLELAILDAKYGVAENGGVWIEESQMPLRIIPFICEHLVIRLQVQDIVPTMHHLYETINLKSSGYCTFIAGPSKTADIEQSLVVGAQGSRTHTVVLQ